MYLYWQLFYTYFKIGLFGFGGGAAMLPLIQFELVEHFGWITATEFTNMVAVSQMTPGPIGINCATYAGYLATGSIWGSVIATFAIILPSFIIMLLVAKILQKFKNNRYVEGALSGLRPAVIGLIAAAALLLINTDNFGDNYADYKSWIIFALTFVLIKWLKIHPIVMILIVAIVGLVIY
ncbi:MAG: chromate transporter [Sphingobacteriia bacterium]|jgi:chromate transporter|nr:chromate transporter [Paludibacteraceae bacterium]NCA78732.1 chromate transporter [Sphingobacteriia bacterium]